MLSNKGAAKSAANPDMGSGRSLACIFSVEGLVLSDSERALFRDANPAGFILFARNCADREQMRALTKALREIVGRDCPILIDQEGGRVQRMKPPVWRETPPMRVFGEMAEREGLDRAKEALRFEMMRMAEELADAGVNVNCAPVLDILTPVTHEIIGDRSFGSDPELVAALGEVVCTTLLEAGIVPVIKHIPGHGRAASDSHLDLPVVDENLAGLDKDFEAFRIVSKSPLARHMWAMTAHVVYTALDAEAPATLSPRIINEIIRKDIGFPGLLIGDDLDMKALDKWGGVAERALACLDAGCDLALYCAGDLKAMETLAGALPKSGGRSGMVAA